MELVAGQAAPQLGHGGQAGQVGRLGFAVGGDVAGHHHHLIDGQLARRERGHGGGQLTLAARPGPPRSRARPGDRPVFQATHCSQVKIPAPSQQRDANTSPTRATRRAWAAFNWPHTSLRAASISAPSIRTSVPTGVLQSFPLIGAQHRDYGGLTRRSVCARLVDVDQPGVIGTAPSASWSGRREDADSVSRSDLDEARGSGRTCGIAGHGSSLAPRSSALCDPRGKLTTHGGGQILTTAMRLGDRVPAADHSMRRHLCNADGGQ